MSVRVGVSLNEIAIWFWFFLYCGIPTQGRRFTKLVLSLSILKGVCQERVQCTCTCDTDGLPLSWEIYYQACSTRCLSNFPSLTSTLKTDKKGVPFVHSLWEFSGGGHARYSRGSHWNATPASTTHSHASSTWGWKEKFMVPIITDETMT